MDCTEADVAFALDTVLVDDDTTQVRDDDDDDDDASLERERERESEGGVWFYHEKYGALRACAITCGSFLR